MTRGLANSFQAVSELVVYTYLTNAHWQPGLAYTAVRWDDPDIGIRWPVSDVQLSDKDAPAPLLRAETYYRHQIMLRAPRMRALSQRLAAVTQALVLPEEVTLSVDIDPMDLA